MTRSRLAVVVFALAAAVSSAGCALACCEFRGSRLFGLTVIGTQLIPGSMFLLPQRWLVKGMTAGAVKG